MSEHEPGRELDALIYMAINDVKGNLLTCRYVDGDWQIPSGTQGGHISPPNYSTDIGAAMLAFMWLAERGIVRLSNGDGDSYDCNFLPTAFPPDDLKIAHSFVDKFNWQGTEEEAWAYTICLAALAAVEDAE